MQFRSLLAGSAMLALLAGCATGGPSGQDADAGVSASQEQYKGTLPCRNCEGIDLDVTMVGQEMSPAEERTFTLDATYRNHPQTPPPENYAGNWEVLSGTPSDPDATVYELTPNGDGQVYYFQRINERTLELIDPERRRFENGEMLQLQRQ